MARPGWDVKQAREAAGLRAVQLARNLGLPDQTIKRVERSIRPMGSTSAADALIAAIPTISAAAQVPIRGLLRRWSPYPRASLALPGTTVDYASTPDSAAVSVTGDIEIRVRVAPDSWAPAAEQVLVSKWTGGGNVSYYLFLNSPSAPGSGLRLGLSVDGTTGAYANSVLTGFPAGAIKWVKATWRASDGRVQYFGSDDNVTYTQIGANQSIAIASIFDGAAALAIGARDSGSARLSGKIYEAQVRNGIGGTVVAKFEPALVTATGPRTPTSFVASTGETWTMNGTGWSWAAA